MWGEIGKTVLQFGLPTLLVVLGAGATAWFSIRTNVRQHVWQTVFQAKWNAIHDFATALDDYSRLVMALQNGVMTWKETNLNQGFARLWGLFEFAWPDSRRPANVAQAMQIFPAPGSTLTRSQLEGFLAAYRNLVIQDLTQAYERITIGFSKLALIGLDPQVPKDMEILSMNWLNKFANAQMPYSDVNFDRFYPEWKAQGRLTKLRLREDLHFSAKSLGKALKVNKDWKRQVESMPLPNLD